MSKISILVAAYNVEKYISEALSSAVSQTMKDIEIVVVDDCSKDKTFEIIKKYAELDSRIKIVRHKENGGILRTRRDGFLNSTGDYIMFLDGDDALTLDACETAYKAITEEQVDMLEFGYNVIFDTPTENNEIWEQNLRNELRSLEHKAVSISKAGILDHKAAGGTVSTQLWNKIFKRTVLTNAAAHVPDEYLNMADDVFFSFFIHFYVHKFTYIPKRLYNYKFGCGMSTTNKLSDSLLKSISKMAYVYHYLTDFAKKQGALDECESALQYVFRKTYYGIAGNYFHRVPKDQKKDFIAEVMKYGTPEDLVLGISEHLYTYSVTPEQVAKDCSELEVFASKKKKAKTIGIYYFRVYNGGVENVISSLSDMWIKQGYKVVLFTDEEPNKEDYYINPAVKRIVVPAMKEKDFKNRKDRINVFRKGLIDNEVDVMVYNAWVSHDLVFDEMIIKSCGVNLIMHTHNLFCCEIDNYDGYFGYLYSSLPIRYAFVDSVVAITDVDAAWWKAVGFKALKTINPIQFDKKTPLAALKGNNILVMSRLSEEKQIIDSLKVAEQVKKEIPDVKLTIVGKGDNQYYINLINRYIEENNLQDLVDMVGFKLDVLPYYQEADVVLSTSRFEGFGLTLMESKMCGVPLICYELSNLDITKDSRGTVIIDQGDVNGAAKAIVKILKDNALKKEMGRKARESVEDFYSVELTDLWDNIFKETLAPKPERTPIYKLPAIETALHILVDKNTEGIKRRFQVAVQQAQQRIAGNADLDARLAESNARCAALDRSRSEAEAKSDEIYALLKETDAKYVALDKNYLALDARYVSLDKRYLELDARYVEMDRVRLEAETKYAELKKQIAVYKDELVGINRSESYRIGKIVTFIPRMIKALLKKIFRRKKS